MDEENEKAILAATKELVTDYKRLKSLQQGIAAEDDIIKVKSMCRELISVIDKFQTKYKW